jgi:tetratricopeptide (TPR) repeat protein
MNPLAPPDTHHLLSAQGWLELGDHIGANEELEKITPSLRAHPNVLAVRYAVYAKAGNWEACVDIGTALVELAPQEPNGWIQRSYALHELKQTQQAADLLVSAANLFPENWLIRYNLACYACQLGNHEEAWDWLESAFELGDANQIKLMALEDADLEPFWAEIGEI